jgi:hypothetical protein
MPELNETRSIDLPAGGVLTVQLSPEFLSIVKKHFNVSEVTDDHIRMFIWGAVDGAVTKAERQASQG